MLSSIQDVFQVNSCIYLKIDDWLQVCLNTSSQESSKEAKCFKCISV